MEQILLQLKEQAKRLDAEDKLKDFKALFRHVDPEELYMDGNSLGRMPVSTREYLTQVIDTQWSEQLIRSWGETWYDAPVRIGDKLGELIGAKPGEVVISDSTTINLFKLVVSALKGSAKS